MAALVPALLDSPRDIFSIVIIFLFTSQLVGNKWLKSTLISAWLAIDYLVDAELPGSMTSPILERRLRIGKKRALYLPREILEAIGLQEGDLVVVRVENGRIVVEKVLDAFLLATKRRKWASTTVEEFEEESESEQEDWGQ